MAGVFGDALGLRAMEDRGPTMKPEGLHGGEGTALFWESEALGSGHQPAPWASVSSLLRGVGGGQTPLTSSLWPLLPRSPRWTGPGPSTFPGSRRAILASTPAGPRTRLGLRRGTSISSCSVSEAEPSQLPSVSGPAAPPLLGGAGEGNCLLGARGIEGRMADLVPVFTELWGQTLDNHIISLVITLCIMYVHYVLQKSSAGS